MSKEDFIKYLGENGVSLFSFASDEEFLEEISAWQISSCSSNSFFAVTNLNVLSFYNSPTDARLFTRVLEYISSIFDLKNSSSLFSKSILLICSSK